MTFHVVVPPQEVPLALWAAADRLLALPAGFDDAEVERHRRIVAEERAVNLEDVAFRGAQSELFRTMFPAPHPLHGMVIGLPAELATVRADDVRAFAARCLVPANAIVTIAGTFDPVAARDAVGRTLGALPGGARLAVPSAPPRVPARTVTVPEARSRRPRVVFAWRFGELPVDVANTLDFGAMLVTVSTDGTLGMDVEAGSEAFLGGHLFSFAVTLAHEGTRLSAFDHAEALLRYLTRARTDDELFSAALLAQDRVVMARLDNPVSRATLLTRLEYLVNDPEAIARFNERHWLLLPWEIQPVARRMLEKGRFTLHARPLNPRPMRTPRE
jgi:predicted Zn-dependent peptidase